jgi:8-oxo-dGTP diphosphatase
MPLSVAGIAVENGKYFIARRKSGGDLGGKWEFPGGKVEEGESDEEALIREYDEEFSLPVAVGPLLGKTVFEHKGKDCSLNGYAVRFLSSRIRLNEHTEWRWAGADEIKALDFAASDLKLLDVLPDTR